LEAATPHNNDQYGGRILSCAEVSLHEIDHIPLYKVLFVNIGSFLKFGAISYFFQYLGEPKLGAPPPLDPLLK
jgi:hypothetical protein